MLGHVGSDGEVVPAEPSATREVIRPQVAEEVQRLMRAVVCDPRGTGERAQRGVENFSVAGKTGTGLKAQPNGTYENEDGEHVYYASFVGFFPAEDPQVTVLVSIDEPPAGDINRFGGTAAAPVFARTRRRRSCTSSGIQPPARATRVRRVTSMNVDPVRDVAAAVPPDCCSKSAVRPAASSTDLTHDSRQVGPGWVFACVGGEHLDGHEFAAAAVDQGAVALLVERRLPIDVPQIVVADVRRDGSCRSCRAGPPGIGKLRMIGITGTNGKTTTTHLLASILRGGRGERTSARHARRESARLRRRPTCSAGSPASSSEGVDAVVMEVSSHALALHRVAGTRFDVAVFTNLGRDHLDLHDSMEAYFRAKASLFDRPS